jgi:hypothetical protein
MFTDYIYYTATTTESATASSTVITASMFIPFFDYLLVLTGFCFTILFVWFCHYMLYTRKK